jgi:hypothetical protein
MLWESQTAQAVAIIAQGRGISDADQWRAIFEAAEQWKPEGLDLEVGKLRDQYEGRILPQLEQAAQKRFPFTFHKMPMTPFNWARLYAQNSASVYDWPAHNYLERTGNDSTKVELTSEAEGQDGQRAADFDAMCREADLNAVMAEAERRVNLTGTVFLRPYSDSVTARATGADPITKVSIFWPTDVWVIPHPACPTVLESAVGVILRVASPDGVNGKTKAFELWTRGYTDDGAGLPSGFTSWTAQRVLVGDEGEKVKIEPIAFSTGTGTQTTYPLEDLPLVAWHNGIPDGAPYMPVHGNLVPLFNAANTALMAEQYASDMSSATPLVRKTNAKQPPTIALGPGVMPAVPLEDEIIPIAMSADFEGMRSVTRGLLGAMALTSRQRIEGYDVEAQGQPVSGVALKIKGEPQAKARLESVSRAIDVHERLLTLMIAIHDFYRGTGIAGDGIEPRMRPTDPPEYEDREATVRRMVSLRDAGLASDLEVRMVSGLSRTAEDAKAALEQIKAEKAERAKNRAAIIGGPFETATPDPEDEHEDEEQDNPPEAD